MKDDPKRPAAFPHVENLEERLEMFREQYENWLPAYKEQADIIINVDGKTPEQVADEIIGRYGKKPSSLIPVMQDIQEAYRYLPGELLSYVAKQIGVKEAKAYSVATFYENFSFEEKGKYVIRSVTVPPVTCGSPLRFWRLCSRSLD